MATSAHQRARQRYDTEVAVPMMLRQFKRAREIYHGEEDLPKGNFAVQVA